MMVLEVKNIGGLTGKQKFELGEGVNEIVAPNAVGKTSLVRAIVSLLAPLPPEQLLNLDADEGYVKLKVNGKEYVRVFKRIKERALEVESKPLAKDEKFRYIVLDPEIGLISRRIMIERNPDITDYVVKVFKLDEMRVKLEELRKRLDELRIKREGLERDVRELKEKSEERGRLLRQHEEVLNELKLLKAVEVTRVKDIEEKLESLTRKLGSIDARIKDIREETIPGLKNRIKEIEFEIERQNSIIKEFYLKHKEPEREIEEIKRRIDEVDKTWEEFERELRRYSEWRAFILKAYEEKADVCPVCGRPVEEPEKFWGDRVTSTESIISSYKERLGSIKEERSRLWSELENLQISYNEIREIEGVKLPNLKLEFKRLSERLENYIKEVERLEVERKIIQEEIERLKSALSEEEKEFAEKRAVLEEKRGAIEQRIKDLDEIIKSKSKAGEELIKVEEEIRETSELIDREEKKFHEVLSTMSEEFVKMANELIKEFNFEWFRGIRLIKVSEEGKDKYVIRVIRRFPSGREYEQPLELLSSSERFIVSLIAVLVGYRLRIVEEYGRDIPIIADESLLALDPERLEKAISELRKYSRYAVITKLARPEEVPTITVIRR